VGLSVPGDRPVWPRHRRVGLPNRDKAATRRFVIRALEHGPSPTEVITDQAAVYPPILDEVAPGSWHHTEPYANNRIESDHGQVKSRLRPMRG
jgi:transposase-like protein